MKRPGRWWTAAQIVSLACAGWCLSEAQGILNQPPTVTKTSIKAQSAGKSLVGRLNRGTGGCLTLVTTKDLVSQHVIVPQQAHVSARELTVGNASVRFGDKTAFTVVPLTMSQATKTYGVTIPRHCVGNYDTYDDLNDLDVLGENERLDTPETTSTPETNGSPGSSTTSDTSSGNSLDNPTSPDLSDLDDVPTLVLVTAIASDG